MSTWTTPATWVNGAVTATQMNTEIRDHLNFLKGALDLITNSTTADTGVGTRISLKRNATTDAAFEARLNADTDMRVQIDTGGAFKYGTGTSVPAIYFQGNNGGLQIERVANMVALTKLFTKAGAINDTDIPASWAGASTGLVGVDTTNSRLYVRVGATWKFAALT